MKHSSLVLYVVYTFSIVAFLTQADSTFNNQVVQRVKDDIAAYTEQVSLVAASIKYMVDNKMVNLSDPFSASRDLLAVPKQIYFSKMTGLQVCLASKLFYMIRNVAGLPNGVAMYVSNTNDPTVSNVYSVTPNGNVGALVYNQSFNCQSRNAYILGKTITTKTWIAPFFSALDKQTSYPLLSIADPIFNITNHGKYYKSFAGIISTSVRLDQINTYLQNSFLNTDINVFVVEKSSGYLLCNSMNASAYTTVKGAKTLLLATQSSNSLIAGATTKLYEENWPNHLIVYNGFYVQSTIYKDNTPGIEWYVIVIQPAQIQPDHLDSSSSMYSIIIGLASTSIIITIISLLLTIIFWRSRMMQLTQPIFTIIVLFGCLLLSISCILFLGKNTSSNCSMKIFVFNLAFTMAFAPLLIKCLRIYSLFIWSWKATVLVYGGKNRLITPLKLTISLLFFLFIDIIKICVTVYSIGNGSEPITQTLLTSNGAYAEMTYCGYHSNMIFFYSELIFKCILILCACYLSLAIRNLADAVAGSKILLIIIYNTAFIGTIIITMSRLIDNIEIVLVCETAGICFCVILTSLLLVCPTIHTILFIGDKEGAVEAIDQMFQGKKINSKDTLGGGGKSVIASGMIEKKVSTSIGKRMSDAFGGGGGGKIIPSLKDGHSSNKKSSTNLTDWKQSHHGGISNEELLRGHNNINNCQESKVMEPVLRQPIFEDYDAEISIRK